VAQDSRPLFAAGHIRDVAQCMLAPGSEPRAYSSDVTLGLPTNEGFPHRIPNCTLGPRWEV